MDDIYVVRGKGQAIVICMFLNEQHPKIKFTIEHEVKKRLPFLDTAEKVGGNSIRTGCLTWHFRHQ